MFTSCKKESNPTSPSEDASTVTYSGKVYHTVKIGSQTWLKENLDVGVMIQGTANQSNNGVIEKYCYNNDTANCTKYGGLYQWDEAMAYDTAYGAKGICPTGWHIPTNEEFETLKVAVKDDGNSLKAIGQGTGSGVGTNTNGFSGLLAGYRNLDGNFSYLLLDTGFWSSTEFTTTTTNCVELSYRNSVLFFPEDDNEVGLSIRCIKDN